MIPDIIMRLTLDSRAVLNNGVEIPLLGVGVYQSPPGQTTENAVRNALMIGYRLIDTAQLYGNEEDVGRALRKSGVSRDDVFIITKVWNSDQGYESTLQACNKSLQKLGLSYLDLYLIHWPVHGMSEETWKAMVRLLQEQKTRAIGVSNYDIDDLSQLMQSSDVLPAVDQVEFHPFLYQERLLRFCEKNGIQMEAYSPLTRGMRISHPTIVAVANKYRKTPAQVLIRWNLQHGLVVIPKSVHEERILENSKVFDFELEPEDMEHLNSLNENLRTIFLS
jgi:diketogulonate reductase-like aldo/keto reductase